MIVKTTTVRHVAIYAHVCPVLTGGLRSLRIGAVPYLVRWGVGYLSGGGWVFSVMTQGQWYHGWCDHMMIAQAVKRRRLDF